MAAVTLISLLYLCKLYSIQSTMRTIGLIILYQRYNNNTDIKYIQYLVCYTCDKILVYIILNYYDLLTE